MQLIEFVSDLQSAVIVLLPMSWNYYVKEKEVSRVAELVNEAAHHGKRVLSFVSGDYGVKVPNLPNLVVLRASGHRSRLPATHLGLPPFIADPVDSYFEAGRWQPTPYSPTPKVGFCGMANPSYLYALEELKRIALRNMLYYLSRFADLPQAFIPTTLRRAQLLGDLEKHGDVACSFICRKDYRAGARTDEDVARSANEFYSNIRDNQYVLCFRGAGNFSVRFYETLAMGRIPVFVNTDCLLPLQDKIAWKEHLVWVEYADRHNVAKRLLEFHRRFDAQSFEQLQKRNRELWEDSLTLNGFFTKCLDVRNK